MTQRLNANVYGITVIFITIYVCLFMHLRRTFKCNIMTGSVCVPLNLERRVMVLSCISGETDERSVNSLFFASTTPHDWIYTLLLM